MTMTEEEIKAIEARASQETHGYSINITCPKCGHVGDVEASFTCCEEVPKLIAEVRAFMEFRDDALHDFLDLIRNLNAERERCACIAEAQEFYPDTHTGMRQQWVKEQIAAKIRKGKEATVASKELKETEAAALHMLGMMERFPKK